MILRPIYFAYFYKPNSPPVDGWRERLVISCEKDGSLRCSPCRVPGPEYVRLGHWEMGHVPKNVWDAARAPLLKQGLS